MASSNRSPRRCCHADAARAIGVMDAPERFHEADAVCLVTGPWTGPLLAPLGAMAELITNGAAATADPSVILSAAKDLREAIRRFSYTRFMEGKLISGEHEYAMGSDFGHTL